MAVRKLSLLLLVFSVVKPCHPRPLDFVCSAEARNRMNIAEKLRTDMEACKGSDQLPISIKLPCTGMHIATWNKMSIEERWTLVHSSLHTLQNAVRSASSRSSLQCQINILSNLERNAQNHLFILRNLGIQGASVPPEDQCRETKTQLLAETLNAYKRLLQGRLDRFFKALLYKCSQHT